MTVTRLPIRDLPAATQSVVNQEAFFSSAGFATLWEAMGGRPVYWVAGDAEAPEGVLAGVEFGLSIWRRFQSMPDGCYGGIISPARKSPSPAVRTAVLAALAKAGYAKLHVYDFSGSCGTAPGFSGDECHTPLVDIASPDWLPPDKTLQAEIRKAEREGAAPTSFDCDRHMDKFMVLMAATEQRHGRPPRYSEEFFRRLAELARSDDRVIWNVIEHEGGLAAAHIDFIERDMLLNWQVCFDKRFSYLKPNQALLFAAARSAAGRGARVLNLGASPDEAETLAAYKRKWGGRDVTYRCLRRYSWLGRLA